MRFLTVIFFVVVRREKRVFFVSCVFTLTFLGLDERHLGSLFAPILLFTRLKHWRRRAAIAVRTRAKAGPLAVL
jgi:hypothetical protein